MSVSAVGRELAAEVIDEVRNWLARSPGELTPYRVAAALHASGRPVGDATVLMVYEELRREVVANLRLTPGDALKLADQIVFAVNQIRS